MVEVRGIVVGPVDQLEIPPVMFVVAVLALTAAWPSVQTAIRVDPIGDQLMAIEAARVDLPVARGVALRAIAHAFEVGMDAAQLARRELSRGRRRLGEEKDQYASLPKRESPGAQRKKSFAKVSQKNHTYPNQTLIPM